LVRVTTFESWRCNDKFVMFKQGYDGSYIPKPMARVDVSLPPSVRRPLPRCTGAWTHGRQAISSCKEDAASVHRLHGTPAARAAGQGAPNARVRCSSHCLRGRRCLAERDALAPPMARLFPVRRTVHRLLGPPAARAAGRPMHGSDALLTPSEDCVVHRGLDSKLKGMR